MTFGVPDRGNQAWTLEEEASRPARCSGGRDQLLPHGQRLPDGNSGEIVGRALKEFTSRNEVVIATKVHGRMRPDPMEQACPARPST